jgi:PAS domain S-box-containing protein
LTVAGALRSSAQALAWLGVGLCAAGGAALWQARDNDALARERFDALADRAVDQVSDRMHAYEYGLRGTRGAIIAAGGENGITRLRFAQYSASRDIEREFPGARGFGFVRRVPAGQEGAFVAAVRQDGRPDFRIHQIGPNDGERYVVQYMEHDPADDTRAFVIGLDIASEPNRRAAAERAMLSGEATLTAPITLVQTGHTLRSFLLLLPVYRADTQMGTARRRAHSVPVPLPAPAVREETVGWIYTPLVIDEVLKGLDLQQGQVSLALIDATLPGKPERFFVSPGTAPPAGALASTLPLQLFGRSWHVEITAQPLFTSQLNLPNPWTVFGIGALLALLLALLAQVRQTTRSRTAQADEQRSRLAAIVTSSNDAIIGRRVDGTITDWNDAAAKIFGYSADEAVGQPLQALLVPPAQLPEEEELIRHIAQGKSVAAFETFRRHRDGTLVPVSVAAAPIRGADGRVTGAAQTVRDITHEHVTKAHILELNATLAQQVDERGAQLAALSTRERAILAGAASAIIATDVNGVVTLFNPAAEALLGYSAEEVVDRMEMNRFHDVFEVHGRAMALTTELGRPLEVCEVFAPAPGSGMGQARPKEWTYVRKNGSRVPVHLNVSPLQAADGTVVGFIAIATDLLERKQVEQRMRNNERFMRIVTDNIPGIVAYWTPDMRCTFANSAYERWMGRTPEQMIGISQMEMLGPTRFRANEPYLRAVLAGQEQRVARSRTIPDGTTLHYWLHYIPDRDDAGIVRGFISVAVDITDMKRAQEQLETLNVALNERSAQAESASKAKSEFLANMSHEIRSPLNAVIGLAYLLRQTKLEDRQRALLEKIDTSSNALLGVINDILDISKIEAGGMVLDETEFGLRELLDGVIAMMAVNANDKGIALVLEGPDDLPAHLVGDLTRIRQILVNLLSNAIKFTARGSVRLSVMAQRRAGNRVMLRLAVIDTGIGIEQGVAGRLFTPFTQADTSTTRRFGGTGLGLSIVKQLVDLMRGEFGVESTPGLGSEFWVVLPLGIASEAAVPPLAAEQGATMERRLSRMRVLVVDDSPVNLEVCQHILEREGAQVGTARDGREAVERLRAAPDAFDVVLMDVHMPVLDGNEATRLIRGELGLAALPVIALTASALLSERERALEAGMNDFISKPFDAELLIRSLRRNVGRVRGGRVVSAPEPTDGAAPLPADWPLIEGVDAADAFRRLGGDAGLLLSVLRRLLEEFEDLAGDLIGDMARADATVADDEASVDLAARLHKLQGSAGVIGVPDVRRWAVDAEAGLKEGDVDRAEAALRALGAALSALRRAAQPFFDAADAAAQAGVVGTPIGPEDLALLVDALRRQSMEAMSLVDDFAPSLRASLGKVRFVALSDAMRALQFKRALEILQEGELT